MTRSLADVEQRLDFIQPAQAVLGQGTARGYDPPNKLEHRHALLAIRRKQLRQRLQRQLLIHKQHQILVADYFLEPSEADMWTLVLRGDLLQGREGALVDPTLRHAHIDNRPDA